MVVSGVGKPLRNVLTGSGAEALPDRNARSKYDFEAMRASMYIVIACRAAGVYYSPVRSLTMALRVRFYEQ